MEKGYLLMKDNGRVWQWDMWQAGMGLVDFTNPDACSWYQSKLKALLDVGVDCFKTDFGERVPTNVKWFDGSDPEKMHNYYTYLYNQCVFELLKKEKGESEAVLFARSAAPGGQKISSTLGRRFNQPVYFHGRNLKGRAFPYGQRLWLLEPRYWRLRG